MEEKGLNEGKQCAASVLVASLTFAPEASVCRRGKKKRKKKEKKRERERQKGEKMEVEEERAEVRVLYGSAEVAGPRSCSGENTGSSQPPARSVTLGSEPGRPWCGLIAIGNSPTPKDEELTSSAVFIARNTGEDNSYDSFIPGVGQLK